MKTKFKDLLDTPLKEGGFTLASKTLDIGGKAERIAQHARDKQTEDGEFAKFHASNIESWMQEIVDMAQDVLNLTLERDKR